MQLLCWFQKHSFIVMTKLSQSIAIETFIQSIDHSLDLAAALPINCKDLLVKSKISSELQGLLSEGELVNSQSMQTWILSSLIIRVGSLANSLVMSAALGMLLMVALCWCARLSGMQRRSGSSCKALCKMSCSQAKLQQMPPPANFCRRKQHMRRRSRNHSGPQTFSHP